MARITLEHEKVGDCQLSVAVTTDAEIHALNRRYAAEDKPTDVLAFSQEEGEEFVSAPGELRHLGDVVISLETAERQASEAGHDLDAEMAHLLAHGVLHLLGYDHAAPDEEREMRQRERAVLAKAGVEAH
ncbi:MAG: rRNA maturation RNase YbeY [Chloroflexi bacterium]|nr:rRNA maturation RNase YbeY [Chloroflexota bacterium]MCI0885285.1 rRNA maturation RNase YbeY [Chloroflexota bacterium]